MTAFAYPGRGASLAVRQELATRARRRGLDVEADQLALWWEQGILHFQILNKDTSWRHEPLTPEEQAALRDCLPALIGFPDPLEKQGEIAVKQPKMAEKPAKKPAKPAKSAAIYDFPGNETYGAGQVRVVKDWVVVERTDSGAPPGEAEKIMLPKDSLGEPVKREGAEDE